MIQPTELRIGNWLFIPGLERYVTVSAIFKSHFRCEDKHGVMFDESIRINYQPIPLTPEVMEKCGFVINPNCEHPSFDGYIHKDWPQFGIGDFNGEEWIIDGIDQWMGSTQAKLNYLHQLQNTFYCTTGTELNYQP